MADSSNSTLAPSATPDTLENFTINGIAPFFSAGDDGDQALEEAHALLTLLTAAFEASEHITKGSDDPNDPITNLRPGIIATAIEGVARLVALGQYRNSIYVGSLQASGSAN